MNDQSAGSIGVDISEKRVSLIVPMYNEELAIPDFFKVVLPIIKAQACAFEIVCVNDGSRDGTLQSLQIMASQHPEIRIVDLARNFGKENALSAGLDYASGDAIIFMDADLQDPPSLIPQFIEKWQAGYDVVYGKRASRMADSKLKRITAALFYKTFNAMSDVPVPEQAGDCRLIDKRVADVLRQFPERNRFMKGLLNWVGFNQVAVEFERPARSQGQTKWNLWQLWNFALDGITGFTTIPLRVWSYLGAASAIFAFFYAIYLMAYTVITGGDVPGYASIMVAILFLGGIQLIGLGVNGEYLGRLYQEVKHRPIYIVNRTYGFEDGADKGPTK